jgi:hypothetical protein
VQVVWRLLSVGALLMSIAALALSIIFARHEERLRPRFDLIRLALTIGTTTFMARVLGVTTPEALMGVGLLGGLLVGLYEGLHLQVRLSGRRALVRRSALGLVAWGVGVVVIQGAAVIGRTGLANVGLTVSFFGIGQLIGLLTGEWQLVTEARRVQAGRLAGTVLLLVAGGLLLPGGAAWAQETDVPAEELGGGDVQVTLRWSSRVDLDLSVTDPAGDTVSYSTRSIPSGGQIDHDANFPCSTATEAPVENVFWPPGQAPRGSYRVAVTYQIGCGTDPAEAYELTVRFGDEVAQRVAATIDPSQVIVIDLVYEGPGSLPGGGELTAAEGTGTSMVGLGGTVLLMGTALMGSGNSAASLLGAWRGGGLRGLNEAVASGAGRAGSEFAWHDPAAAVNGGRISAALEHLPPGLRGVAQQEVVARLEGEQVERLADIVREAVGAEADPGAALAPDGKASKLLSRLPAGVRERVEEKVLGSLREARVQGVVEAAVGGEGLLTGEALDTEPDLLGAVRRSDRFSSLLAGLPEELKIEAEGRLVDRLESERLGHWLEKLRPVAAPTVDQPGGSVLDGRKARHVLAGLPRGLREKIRGQASGALEREMVEKLVSGVKQVIERAQAADLLQAAIEAGDGRAADAVIEAAEAALDLADEVELEDLVRRAGAVGLEDLESLSRAGEPLPGVDLIAHLDGEADLLATVRRIPGVEEVLASGAGLRPQVEQALVETLDAERIGRAVSAALQGG